MTADRIIYVVDDEAIVSASIVSLVEAHGAYRCREYRDGTAFLDALDTLEPGCVILDLQLDGASGEEIIAALSSRAERFRAIIVTGYGDLATAIDAFRAGAVDFLYKPYEIRPLLDAIERAFHLLDHGRELPEVVVEARGRIARLNPEEAEIAAGLIQGRTNQELADEMGLDPRTVQIHRARALAVLEAPSILAAIRTAAIAGWPPA